MKIKIYLKLAIIVVALNSGSILAGPFGLEMGMTLDQIDKNAKMLAPGKYQTKLVPKPHSSFEYYILQISPKTGLCWIKAVGNDLKVNTYGHALQTAFDEMRQRLGTIYGSSELTDRLLPGSIWNEPKDWMPGLVKNERILIAKWNKPKNDSLKGDVDIVVLAAKANKRESGYLAVDYHFKNEANCDKEIDAQADDSL